MPLDPYGNDLAGPPVWDGAWPPDPSWDDPTLAAPPVLPPPVESPVPDEALALPVPPPAPEPVDPYAPQPVAGSNVRMSLPTNPDAAQAPGAPQLDEINPDLIEIDAGPADWSGLEQGQPVDPYADGADQPWDADLIEQDAAPLTDEERSTRLASVLPTLSDEDLALRQYQNEQAAEDEAIASRSRAAAADRKAAEDNERVYRTATERTRQQTAMLDAESDRLANERVDPDGWRDSRGLFQTLAMYAAGMVGGLVQSRTGGPNQGLAMINDAIEKHIDAQKANLEHRRDMLGRKQDRLGAQQAQADGDYQTEEAFRQAAWKRAIADIDSTKQQFNPVGTHALKYEALKRDLAGQAAAARQAAAEKTLDREIKIGTYDLAVAAQNETNRKNLAAEQLAARKAAGSGSGGSAAKTKYDPASLAKQFGVDPAKVVGMPPMTIGEFGQYLETAKKGRALNEPTDLEKRTAENGIFVGGKPLEWENGVPAGKPEDVSKLRLAIIYGGLKADLIDEVLAIRDRVGGESAWGNSDDFQKLKVLGAQLRIYAKAPTEGLSSENDMKLVADSIGAGDIASFRSRAAGLKKGRELTTMEVNALARGAGLKGSGIAYPNVHKAPKLTAEQKKVAELAKSTTGEKKQSIPTVAVLSPVGALARGVEFVSRSENPNLGDGEEKTAIDAMVADATGAADPARRQEAAANLTSLADTARSPAVRAYARNALRAARAAAHRQAGDFSPFLSALVDEAPPAAEGEE